MQVNDLQNKIKTCIATEIKTCIESHNQNVKYYREFLSMIDNDLNESLRDIKCAFESALLCVISVLTNYSPDKYYVKILCEMLILGFRVHYKHLLHKLHKLCVYANILERVLILHGWELVRLLNPDKSNIAKSKIQNTTCSIYSYGFSVKVTYLDRIYSDIFQVFKNTSWLDRHILDMTEDDKFKKIKDEVLKQTFFSEIYTINNEWKLKCLPP